MTHNELSEKASEIATNRPRCWEQALFAQVVTEEIKRQQGLASTLPSSTMTGVASVTLQINPGENYRVFEALIKSKFLELVDPINQFSKLLAANRESAFGPLGQPGDPEKIAQLGIQVGKPYADALANLAQAHHFDCSHHHPEYLRETLNAVFAKSRDELIAEAIAVVRYFERMGPEILRRIQDATSKAQPGESLNLDLTIEFKLKFGIIELDAYVSYVSLVRRISTEVGRIDSDSPDKIIKMAKALASIASESLRIADESTEIRTRKSELNKARNRLAKCKNLVAKYSYLSIANLQSIEDMIVAIESETCLIQHTKAELDQELIQGAAAFRDRCDSRRNLRQIYIRRLLK